MLLETKCLIVVTSSHSQLLFFPAHFSLFSAFAKLGVLYLDHWTQSAWCRNKNSKIKKSRTLLTSLSNRQLTMKTTISLFILLATIVAQFATPAAASFSLDKAEDEELADPTAAVVVASTPFLKKRELQGGELSYSIIYKSFSYGPGPDSVSSIVSCCGCPTHHTHHGII